MENRNWNDFRYLNQWEKQYDGKQQALSEQNLQPGVIVQIFFTYTDVPALQRTYQQILDLAGNSFLYHDTGGGHPTRIRDREKALSNFPIRLQNPDENHLIWHALHDFYGGAIPSKGKRPMQMGDLGQAEFSAWINTFAPETWRRDLKSRGRTPVSSISIRMPTYQFADGQSFLNWVLSLELLQSPSLYAASAGYCMWYYVGNCCKEARTKLDRLLAKHPGFYYDVGGWLAESYSPKHNLLKPIVPRVNWLNVLGDDAFLFYPGGQKALYESAKQWPALTLHSLPHGFMVQAGEEPGIGDGGRAPEAYYDANNLLSLFLHRGIEGDYKDWAKHFFTPEILEKLEEQASLLEDH